MCVMHHLCSRLMPFLSCSSVLYFWFDGGVEFEWKVKPFWRGNTCVIEYEVIKNETKRDLVKKMKLYLLLTFSSFFHHLLLHHHHLNCEIQKGKRFTALYQKRFFRINEEIHDDEQLAQAHHHNWFSLKFNFTRTLCQFAIILLFLFRSAGAELFNFTDLLISVTIFNFFLLFCCRTFFFLLSINSISTFFSSNEMKVYFGYFEYVFQRVSYVNNVLMLLLFVMRLRIWF